MRTRTAVVLMLALSASACANTTTFFTEPGGAKLWVNGEACGETPCRYHTRYGFPKRIRVQIEKEGYKPAEFFLDSEPPLATYLLFIVGSYFFHTFEEEYRFNLGKSAPATAPAGVPAPAAPPPPPAPVPPAAPPPPAPPPVAPQPQLEG